MKRTKKVLELKRKQLVELRTDQLETVSGGGKERDNLHTAKEHGLVASVRCL